MAKRDLDREQELIAFAEASGGAQDRVEAAKLLREKGPSTKASSGSWVDWSVMSEFLGQPFDMTRIPLSKLEQMRRDPMLAFGLMFCKMPMIRASWRIECSDPRRAAAVDGALRRIYGRLVLAWTNCFDFGYSGMAKRFELLDPDWTYIDKDDPNTKETPVWDQGGVNMLVWKPFVALNPRMVSPNFDKTGSFAGIHYKGDNGIGVFGNQKPDIPLDWALWATHEQDSVFGSMWGYPKIGYAYRYWWAYWYRFGLADRAFEKWADPPIIAHHPVEAGLDNDGNEVDYGSEALKLAESLRSGANVAMPTSVVTALDERPTNVEEWRLEQMQTNANFAALNEAFEYLDIQKLRAVAVPEHALVEGKGGSSSRNVAGEHGDIFMQSQAVAIAQLDDDINRYLIPQFLEVNFGPGGPPCTKVTTGFDPQDIDTMRALVQAIANSDPSKVPVDMEELLERMGIPVLSRTAIQNELEMQAQAAAELAPPEWEGQPQDQGQQEVAGTDQTGLYYSPREVIRLSESNPFLAKRPLVIERVDWMPDDMPEGSVAYFDASSNTFFVKKDADPSMVSEYMLQLSERSGGNINVVADEGDPIMLELAERLGAIEQKVEDVARSKPVVNVHAPAAPEIVLPPRQRVLVSKEIERDEDGNIIKINELQEEVK